MVNVYEQIPELRARHLAATRTLVADVPWEEALPKLRDIIDGVRSQLATRPRLRDQRDGLALATFAHHGAPLSAAYAAAGVSRDRFYTLRLHVEARYRDGQPAVDRASLATVVPDVPDAPTRLVEVAGRLADLEAQEHAAITIRDEIIRGIPVAEFDRATVASAAGITGGRVSQIFAAHGRVPGSAFGERLRMQQERALEEVPA